MASSRTLFHAFGRIRASTHHATGPSIQAAPWDDRNLERNAQSVTPPAVPSQSWQQPLQQAFPPLGNHRSRFFSTQPANTTGTPRISGLSQQPTQLPALNVRNHSTLAVPHAEDDALWQPQANQNHHHAPVQNEKVGQNSHKRSNKSSAHAINSFKVAIKDRNTTEAWSNFLLLEHAPDLHFVPAKDMNLFLQLVRKSSHKYGQEGNERLEAMERIFAGMQRVGIRPDIGTYVILANAYAQAGDLQKVVQIFEEVDSLNMGEPKMKHAILCIAQAKAGKLQEANSSFRNIIEKNPEIPRFEIMGAYNAVLDAFSKSSEFNKQTVDWFNEAHVFQVQHDGLTYDLMIDYHCNLSEFDSAYKLLAIKERKGFAPTTRSFNSLIRGLLRADKHDEALSVFYEMGGRKVPPNATTYNYVISSHEGTNKPILVWKLYLSMLRAKIVPTRSTWASLAKGIGSNNKSLREDIENADGMPSKLLYRHLMDGYRHLNDADGVIAVLSQYKMEESKAPKSWPVTLDILNTALSGMCEVGKEEEALEIFKEIKQRKFDANQFTYNALISMYSRSVIDPVKAKNILNEMIAAGVEPDSFTFNQMINSTWTFGDPLNAIVVDSARQFSHTMMNYNPKRDIILHRVLQKVGDGDATLGLQRLRSGYEVPLESPEFTAPSPPSPQLLDIDFSTLEERLLDFSDFDAPAPNFNQRSYPLGPPITVSQSAMTVSGIYPAPFRQDAFAPRRPIPFGADTRVTNMSQLFN